MPSFVTPALPEGGGGDRGADPAVVDHLATGLDAGPEKGVGRAAQAQTLVASQLDLAAAVLPGHRQRLLVVHVFARLQCRQRHLRVGLGNGQVDHDIDLWISQQLVDAAHLGNPELFRLYPCALLDQVGAGDDL